MMLGLATIFKTIIAFLGAIFGVFLYAKKQGKEAERNKLDSILLDDVATTKKTHNFVDSLTDAEVDSRLRVFERKRDSK